MLNFLREWMDIQVLAYTAAFTSALSGIPSGKCQTENLSLSFETSLSSIFWREFS